MTTADKPPKTLTLKQLQSHLQNKRYKALLKATAEEADSPQCRSNIPFFRATAYLALDRYEDALSAACHGLERDPQDFWGVQLRHEALVRLERFAEADDRLIDYIALDTERADAARALRESLKAQCLLTLDEIKALHDQPDYDRLLAVTQDEAQTEACRNLVFFFRASALLRTLRFAEAEDMARQGIATAPDNFWGVQLLAQSLKDQGKGAEALKTLSDYTALNSPYAEQARFMYVNICTDTGDLAAGSRMNDTRERIIGLGQSPKYAIAIQVYNKADTLREALTALLACDGRSDFALFILQDRPRPGEAYDQDSARCAEVRRLIGDFLPALTETFAHVDVQVNSTHAGTGASCRKLLDRVSRDYDAFVFLEDDCILTPDALTWARYHLEHSVSPEAYWFVACESGMFDSHGANVPEATRQSLSRLLDLPEFRNGYIEIDAVTSTCFATRADIWRLCASVRSFPRGADSLNLFMRQMRKRTLMPVIGRATDVGMLHEYGYSVAMLGAQNVREIKTPYLISDGFFEPERLVSLQDDFELLDAATCRLDASAIETLLNKWLNSKY